MKKKIIFIIAILIILLMLIPSKNEEFRVRVIAASDSNQDQSAKYAVVRTIKKEINKLDKENIIFEIERNIDIIESTIYKTLKKYYDNPNYIVKITNENFPPKELEGNVIPGGNYRTLLIVIDDGKGKNWWSLLYPNYFNVSFEDLNSGEVEVKSYFYEKIKNIFR